MRRIAISFALALLAFTPHAFANDTSWPVTGSYSIYRSDQLVISSHVVKPLPDGSYSVYKSGQLIIPTHIVRPVPGGNFSVYKSDQLVIPTHNVRSIYDIGESVRNDP